MNKKIPQTSFLKDYQPSHFLIDTVDLTFELAPDITRVKNSMRIYRPAKLNKAAPLRLFGEKLFLESIILNEDVLHAGQYQLTDEYLEITDVPESFTLTVTNTCSPMYNKALDGLYISNEIFCTQCEPHGFRRITYYLDRPDVMAKFTTTIIADAEKYPVLLSNGNLINRSLLNDGRQRVVWEDPYKKPCYLFALVAGKLVFLEDQFITQSGRKVLLQIYVEPGNLDKANFAMHCLKEAMRWDEINYGREYDLDRFMIVAVSDFNMGAMENKGLNIFNSKYILAKPETATDQDYIGIAIVVSHEYFHNWTGNRITCRDWFQLSLKEGLTVFRDHQFTADFTSAAVARLDDIRRLKSAQFSEDAGPLAHPVRPASYVEMNNFYTATIYEKGAELVRMLHTFEGKAGFRRGMDLYFERFDGQAVTCDDFVQAHADANGRDYQQFMRWYSQAGTPQVNINSEYNSQAKTFTININHLTPATPGQTEKLPLHFPLRMALIDSQGKHLPIQLSSDSPNDVNEIILEIKEAQQSFTFYDVAAKPIPSLFRGFSAPVKCAYEYAITEYLILLKHDDDFYNRKLAAEQLFHHQLTQQLNGQHTDGIGEWLAVLRHILLDEQCDPSLKVRLLQLPGLREVADQQTCIKVESLVDAYNQIRHTMADYLAQDCLAVFQKLHDNVDYHFSAEYIGLRSLQGLCLQLLCIADPQQYNELAYEFYKISSNMTNRCNALQPLLHYTQGDQKNAALGDFYHRYQQDALVMEKWLQLQATIPNPDNLLLVKELLQHPAFDLRNPNKARSLIGAFAGQNFVAFHRPDGAGYEFLADIIIQMNAFNPIIAARLIEPLTHWRRFEDSHAVLMRSALHRIAITENLAKDVLEVVTKSLEN